MTQQLTNLTAVEDALKEQSAANIALVTLKREMNEKIEAETVRIREEYSERIKQAHLRLSQAERQVKQAKTEAVLPHEWEGRKVYMVEKIYHGWSRTVFDTNTITGVVRTYRPDLPVPGNMKYGLPNIGDVLVYLCKKDGTEGTRFERFDSSRTMHDPWQLVEE